MCLGKWGVKSDFSYNDDGGGDGGADVASSMSADFLI